MDESPMHVDFGNRTDNAWFDNIDIKNWIMNISDDAYLHNFLCMSLR